MNTTEQFRRGFETAKQRMITIIEDQQALKNKPDTYTLGKMNHEQLELVKKFVSSFYCEVSDEGFLRERRIENGG